MSGGNSGNKPSKTGGYGFTLVALGDESSGVTAEITAAGGLSVAPASPGYDSGIQTVPDSLTVVTASTVRVAGALMCNLTASEVTLTVTNTAGTKYLNAYPLQGNMTVWVPMGNASLVGVKWQASAAASVTAQIVGEA